MKLKKTFTLFLCVSLFFAFAHISKVSADEGMWPFNNIPRADIKKKYGFDVTDEWLKKVQLSSVRFNSGGSGSFVSADGLVMTNHHIAQEVLQGISNEKKDYFKDGFYARSRDDEIKAPDLEVDQLISVDDVTARVKSVVKLGMGPADAQKARASEIAAISDESTKTTRLRSDVVTLYQGGQYNLYRYKKYTDVRLVFAPEFTIAFFGGDPDNFEFPRYDLDLALFRVYENGRPVHTDNYFKFSPNGARDGELVFTTGHPGSTSRLNTYAHLIFFRDFLFPYLIRYLERKRALFQRYSAISEVNASRAGDDLFSIENILKAREGALEGLQDARIMARKKDAENALRAKVNSSAQMARSYGDPWDAIAKARQALPGYEKVRRFLEGGWGFDSRYFNIARILVRMAAENGKPNDERLPEYTDRNRKSLELDLFSPAPIYNDFENLKLADSLALMRDELGAYNPVVQKALVGKTPEMRAVELIAHTTLGDKEVRKALALGGQEAIDKSDDPFIQLAKAVDDDARAVRKYYETNLMEVERTNYAKIAAALFEIEGTKQYPDPTSTLRLSYGAVRGYPLGSRRVEPFTDLAGLFTRAAEHGGVYPYALPQSWLDKKSALSLKTPFNFVTTNDIVGGNAGSPIINSKAEIVGLIFDGNIQSLLGDFIYDEATNRSVGVDSRGMIEALRKVYGANELANELTAGLSGRPSDNSVTITAAQSQSLSAKRTLISIDDLANKLATVSGPQHTAKLQQIANDASFLSIIGQNAGFFGISENYLKTLDVDLQLLRQVMNANIGPARIAANINVVARDLNLKRESAALPGNRWAQDVRVIVKTMSGNKEDGGYQIFYELEGATGPKETFLRFPDTSPAEGDIPPGDYMFWALKDGKTTTKQGPMRIDPKAKQPITVTIVVP